MKNLKEVYLNKKGFTLLEMILGIAITSILLMCFYSILNFSINITKSNDKRDTILSNGRYALLYIKEEINKADKLICISKFKGLDKAYPQNIGFVILEKTTKDKTTNYNYSTYYLKDDGSLIRLACNRINSKYPSEVFFGGHNEVCSEIKTLEKYNYDIDKNILNVKFILSNGEEDFDFKFDMFLNCPIDLSYGGDNE